MSGVVVDSSAVIAVVHQEPTRDALLEYLDQAEEAVMSTVTLVETAIVVAAQVGPAGSQAVEEMLRVAGVRFVEVQELDARRAIEGWHRFGKGRHPARLNLGDLFTYALADATGYPILCVGNDFAQTDLEVLPAR